MIERIGKLIPDHESADRDAVHVAVLPVIAGEVLRAAQRVVLIYDNGVQKAYLDPNETGFAIVDPFLKTEVTVGDRCWLFMYPGTIVSLRHEWTHPFMTSASEKWLRDFAEQYGIEYEELIRGGMTGEGGTFHGSSEGPQMISREYWRHLSVVTNRQYDEDHRDNTYFRCSC